MFVIEKRAARAAAAAWLTTIVSTLASGTGCNSRNDVGPDAVGRCTLLASAYHQSCQSDSDCVAVFLGDVCHDVCRGSCPSAAIHVADWSRYGADLKAALPAGSSNTAAECSCALGPAICRAGMCGVPSPRIDDGGAPPANATADATPDATSATTCGWPMAADTLGDASRGGCRPRAPFSLCTVPNGGGFEIDAAVLAPDGTLVTGTCKDECSPSQYALSCYGTSVPDASGIPVPDPAFGCTIVAEPKPSNVLAYCCPCAP